MPKVYKYESCEPENVERFLEAFRNYPEIYRYIYLFMLELICILQKENEKVIHILRIWLQYSFLKSILPDK
jgi:hypothetical protein